MKQLVIFLVLTTASPLILAWNWSDPESKFEVAGNEISKVRLKWIAVTDVNGACVAENKKRGGKLWSFNVQACSFWQGNECVIYTAKTTSIHSLGHETLHCFRGAYH